MLFGLCAKTDNLALSFIAILKVYAIKPKKVYKTNRKNYYQKYK